MKFGDKLIILRKKNGLSQEELAEKLKVSRQSVSKWESNNTYPETDKIVQICNLFDCSMDDLINDKVTDVEGSLRKNKNNFNEVWDSLLEFISKTVNMFSHMRFIDGLKCFIEMFLVGFILWILGSIICGITSSLISNLFSFFGISTVNTIKTVLQNVFNIFWFVFAAIVLVHTFKIRYLNYYDDSYKEDIKNKEKEDDNNNVDSKKSDEKIIVRDEKNEPFAFLSVLSKIVIIFIKFIVFWIAFSIAFVLIGLVFCSVISIALIPTNLLFVGSSLSLLSGIVINILLLLLCIYFIISKKVNVKVFVITFLAAIVAFGAGMGISVLSIKNFDIVKSSDNKDISSEQFTVEYQDNLVISSYNLGSLNHFNYVVDNSIPSNTILVDVSYDKKNKKIIKRNIEEDKLNVLKISGDFKNDPDKMFKLIINDLKNNKIVVDHLNNSIDGLTITANGETINKLITNTEKLYLLEKEVDGNTTKVKTHGSKVIIYGGRSFVEYNAITDELSYTEIAPKGYKCSRILRKTTWGDRIEYNCLDDDDDIDIDDYDEEDYDD